jgi:hypothetical protein
MLDRIFNSLQVVVRGEKIEDPKLKFFGVFALPGDIDDKKFNRQVRAFVGRRVKITSINTGPISGIPDKI